MRVRLLGPVDVVAGGVPVPIPGPRRKAVLAVLALHGEGIVGTGRLIEAAWGDEARRVSLNTLQSHVSALRRLLGDRTAILARPPGYLLTAGPTDVAEARRLVERGERADDPAQSAATLRAALALWRDRSLVDVGGVAWLDEQAAGLERLRTRAELALIRARLALGEHAQLEPDLDRLARARPFDEQVHAQLMFALYRTGRQADALSVYRRLRTALADHLGIDPHQRLRELETAILRQDPALEVPSLAVRLLAG
ncbi:BTAD domain-containing putative transcriptional regulator [Amycolatopsis sp. CA-128772]|uniref:AfsR/SARP family transcriptional regulator n=1 Tax=Amycolatopsis sp. CA-128772 TaxID=2073159 RepID=UPI001E4F7B2C|nr:BTAD domain-containing putative transcriptional regulator [Amycolatopsis sp. CA-128772]